MLLTLCFLKVWDSIQILSMIHQTCRGKDSPLFGEMLKGIQAAKRFWNQGSVTAVLRTTPHTHQRPVLFQKWIVPERSSLKGKKNCWGLLQSRLGLQGDKYLHSPTSVLSRESLCKEPGLSWEWVSLRAHLGSQGQNLSYRKRSPPIQGFIRAQQTEASCLGKDCCTLLLA